MRRDAKARATLSKVLAQVPPFSNPKPDWEQYATPADLATRVLLEIHGERNLAETRVLDLGCGTGMFALGAAALGAHVVAVDLDEEALAACKRAANAAGLVVDARLHDVASGPPCTADVVVMNPPFGAQKGNRNADRIFHQTAVASLAPGGEVWFLAPTRTERFLAAFYGDLGASVERIWAEPYPLEATMAFHDKAVHHVDVGLYRAERQDR